MLSDGIRPELIVILSDINMPGMDGLTLLGEIKRRWPELRVIMVTAYGDDERRRLASERGAADFLANPLISSSSSGSCCSCPAHDEIDNGAGENPCGR